jgi:hypothetical protein
MCTKHNRLLSASNLSIENYSKSLIPSDIWGAPCFWSWDRRGSMNRKYEIEVRRSKAFCNQFSTSNFNYTCQMLILSLLVHRVVIIEWHSNIYVKLSCSYASIEFWEMKATMTQNNNKNDWSLQNFKHIDERKAKKFLQADWKWEW